MNDIALKLLSTAICLVGFSSTVHSESEKVFDLLFHCYLSDAKHSYSVDMSNMVLFDNQGWVYKASIDENIIEATREQKWDEKSSMRHRLRIDRKTGSIRYAVLQVSTETNVESSFVLEDGECSPEKIHPRHFQR